MRANEVMGIVFSNVHDDLMRELTEKRSMGSVPFGGRYRLIDFSLSNLVNAGIDKAGVITKANYQSLMDHMGSGKHWDLDRKKGGLYILPPYGSGDSGIYTGHVDALYNVMHFLRSSKEKYVVLCDSDVVCNIDLEPMLDAHAEKGADVTIAYKMGRLPRNHQDIMSFAFGKDDRIIDITLSTEIEEDCAFSLDIVVIERTLLMKLITDAAARNYTSLARDVFQRQADRLQIYGWEVTGYAVVMDCTETFVKANMDLLNPEIRAELFTRERPVYTKTRDDMPSKYGLGSSVSNCIIADGCVIDGTVSNSVIFRGVTIGKGAVIENSIVMQDSIIGENARLNYVTTDKNVTVGAGKALSGTDTYPIFIKKGSLV